MSHILPGPRPPSPHPREPGWDAETITDESLSKVPIPAGGLQAPDDELAVNASPCDTGADGGAAGVRRRGNGSSTAMDNLVSAMYEAAGTTAFLFFVFASADIKFWKAGNENWYGPEVASNDTAVATVLLMGLTYASTTLALAYTVNLWMFGREYGGYFNPAITLALLLAGHLTAPRAATLVVSQVVGSLLAAAGVHLLYATSLVEATTTLQGSTTIAQGLLLEAALTAELTAIALVLSTGARKNRLLAPVGLGLAALLAGAVGTGATGASTNPVRSFAPCVIARMFGDDHWIYWLGPMLGSSTVAMIWRLNRRLRPGS